jgi:hypothetical protein
MHDRIEQNRIDSIAVAGIDDQPINSAVTSGEAFERLADDAACKFG